MCDFKIILTITIDGQCKKSLHVILEIVMIKIKYF